jgi:hypothetical protein
MTKPLATVADRDAARPGNLRRSISIDDSIAKMIGEHLSASFAPILNEPVPQRFIELIEQLERGARKA